MRARNTFKLPASVYTTFNVQPVVISLKMPPFRNFLSYGYNIKHTAHIGNTIPTEILTQPASLY